MAVNSVKETKNGSVILKCKGRENELMKSEYEQVLGGDFKVETSQFKKPRIKIVGVEDVYDEKIAGQAIIKQSFEDYEGNSLTVLHIKNIKNKNTSTIFVELDPCLFHELMLKKTVYLGWQKCRIYEDININRCIKCNAYGHSVKKCLNAVKCCYSAGERDSKCCKNNDMKQCVNCLKANKKYNAKANTKHYAHEEDQCDTLKYYKNKTIAQTSY